ncbi:class I SAM-dependent methyltransferase [Candidatus Thorarchaeota archaeon]|nr:MAG: class I SAM-dependent methyltransferase [Candidatus Thorarchaeota archaeon]
MAEHEKNEFSNLGPGYEGVGQFYDLFADNSDLPFYLQYAREAGSPILEIAAGTGRVAFMLARKGFEVVALENSPSMLEKAREKLEREPPESARRITIIQGDMTKFEINRKFSLIIIPASFGHALTSEAQLSTLKCIYNHLQEGGIFILDLFPGALQHEHATFTDSPILLLDGTAVERHGEIHSDFLKQIMRVDLRYIVRNHKQEMIEDIRVVSYAALLFNREVDLLLRLSGFEVVRELGSFECEPYSSESVRRIFVLEKRVCD